MSNDNYYAFINPKYNYFNILQVFRFMHSCLTVLFIYRADILVKY